MQLPLDYLPLLIVYVRGERTMGRIIGGILERPKKNNTMKKQYNVRLSDETMSKLNYVKTATNKSGADVIRDAIDMIYNFEKFKNTD